MKSPNWKRHYVKMTPGNEKTCYFPLRWAVEWLVRPAPERLEKWRTSQPFLFPWRTKRKWKPTCCVISQRCASPCPNHAHPPKWSKASGVRNKFLGHVSGFPTLLQESQTQGRNWAQRKANAISRCLKGNRSGPGTHVWLRACIKNMDLAMQEGQSVVGKCELGRPRNIGSQSQPGDPSN